jgi:hypothetical protein
MVLMEKRIGNKYNPLTIDEIREKLSLIYERLSLVAETTNDIDLTEEKALFTNQFKVKCQICEKMGDKATDCKARRAQQTRVETQAICNYCKKPGNYKADCFQVTEEESELRKQ